MYVTLFYFILILHHNWNANTSFGPDKINPQLLIELVAFVTKPIVLLLNKTMEHRDMPDDWKRAIVSSIFKGAARNRADNYCAVSLASIICKLMESFVKEVIVNYIMDKKKQYGFISGRSTTTQFFRYLDMCIEKTNSIYLDFAKAFILCPIIG